MRLLKLSLACSLDQYIAGPNGEIDWIRTDLDTGLGQFLATVDQMLVGRGTYDFGIAVHGSFPIMMRTHVFTSNPPAGVAAKGLQFVTEDAVAYTRRLKKQAGGKDIWLMGGHRLAKTLLTADLVDEISLAVHPFLLGGGTPLFGPLKHRQVLTLESARAHANGVVVSRYTRA